MAKETQKTSKDAASATPEKKKTKKTQSEEDAPLEETSPEEEGEEKQTSPEKEGAPVESTHPEQAARENAFLKKFLLTLGAIIILMGGIYWYVTLPNYLLVDNVEYLHVEEGQISFYKTAYPVLDTRGKNLYNQSFYLRTHPKKFEEVPFEGNISFRKLTVINFSDEAALSCEGDFVRGIVNLRLLMEAQGVSVFSDPNATCDEESRYTFINFAPGDETKIVQTSRACYEVTVADCDILLAAERYMHEAFIQIQRNRAS